MWLVPRGELARTESVEQYVARSMANEGGLWKIRASVPTGLEISAAEECSAVLGVKPVTFRGCVEFTVSSLDQLHQVTDQ